MSEQSKTQSKTKTKTTAIWNRLESESDLEFQYFFTYHTQGDTRTVGKVATVYNISSRHLYNISKKHNWKKRAEAVDLYNFQSEMRKIEKELKSIKKVRIVTAKNLYKSMNYKMQNFSEYIDFYVPEKAKNLSISGYKGGDEHIDRMWKVLKMVNLYEVITTKFELFFEKEIAKSLNTENAIELDEDLTMLSEDVSLFEKQIEQPFDEKTSEEMSEEEKILEDRRELEESKNIDIDSVMLNLLDESNESRALREATVA